jgi:nicotinamidase-related amidase
MILPSASWRRLSSLRSAIMLYPYVAFDLRPAMMRAVLKGGFTMLNRENAVLVFIDVQGRLSELVDGAEALFKNLRRLLEGMKALGVPVVVTEQIPEKLGSTREEFLSLISEPPVSKTSFSCCGEKAFCKAVEKLKRTQVILCGIETHVCVYQTALDLLEAGYEVQVVTDAVSSRDPANKALALRRLEVEGVSLTGTEMVLFELLNDAKDPAFKSVLQIVK